MIAGAVSTPTSTEFAGWVLRAGTPLLVAALAVAVVSVLLVAWTGIHDPAATWLLRTVFVGGALLVGSAEIWSVATILFERSLGEGQSGPGDGPGEVRPSESARGAASADVDRVPSATREADGRQPASRSVRDAADRR